MALSRKSKREPPRGPRGSWRVSTIVRRVLNARNDDALWKYLSALHLRGTREVVDTAAELCKSRKTKKRRIGADILGQIGVPERKFPEEVLKILHGMLRTETNAAVLNAVLVAIGHTQEDEDMRGIQKIASLQHHRNPGVRFAVVYTLSGREDGKSLNTLIELTEDSDTDVRDWATFGLGTQSDVDSPRIRKALWRRVNDSDLGTRCEAIVGLARRKDPGIRKVLMKELNQEEPSSLIFEATAHYGDLRLLVYLERHLRSVRVVSNVESLWLMSLRDAIKDLRRKLRRRK